MMKIKIDDVEVTLDDNLDIEVDGKKISVKSKPLASPALDMSYPYHYRYNIYPLYPPTLAPVIGGTAIATWNETKQE